MSDSNSCQRHFLVTLFHCGHVIQNSDIYHFHLFVNMGDDNLARMPIAQYNQITQTISVYDRLADGISVDIDGA